MGLVHSSRDKVRVSTLWTIRVLTFFNVLVEFGSVGSKKLLSRDSEFSATSSFLSVRKKNLFYLLT